MPLAEYLASEQAREDVRALLERRRLTPNFTDIHAKNPHRFMGITKTGAWHVVTMSVEGETCQALYRPDGDRFVVTDLGEGVRALRLRTGAKYIDILQKCRRTTRHNHFYGAFGQICDATIGAGNWERGSGIGALFDASTEADRANLPDAICRVMLASLRVAGVSNV